MRCSNILRYVRIVLCRTCRMLDFCLSLLLFCVVSVLGFGFSSFLLVVVGVVCYFGGR